MSFGRSSYSVDEGDSVTITVRLSADPERPVEVRIIHTGQGGASGSDYSGVPDSVIFNSGDTSATFTLDTVGDDVDDGGKSVTLGFGALPEGVSAGTDTAEVTLMNDDVAGVSVSVSALTIDEGGGGAYEVVLDSEPTSPVTVTVGGYVGSDVSVSPGSLTFGAGNWDTAQAVTVTAAHDGDAASDAAATLTHTVTGSGEYAGVAAAAVVVTIVEDDASVLSVSGVSGSEADRELVFTVSISRAAGEEVTVDYATSDGTARAGSDYTLARGTLTFSANSTVANTVSVPVIHDTADEAEEETFTLTLSNARGASLAGAGSTLAVTGTIVDDDDPEVEVSFAKASYDVAEGSSVTVIVRLSKDPERTVEVPISAMNQGGASGSDYSGVPDSVTFTPDDTSDTFTLRAVNDDLDDDNESLLLGFDTPLPDGVSTASPDQATVSIVDDDDPEVEVSFAKASYDVAEGSSVTVIVRLSKDPERTVEVPISAMNQGGASGSDYSGVPDSVTFTPDDTSDTFTLRAVNDDVDDDNESVLLGFGDLPDDRVIPGTNTTVSIGDDDAAGVSVSVSALTVDEGGGGAYEVVLDSEPTAAVTVTVGGYVGSDVSVPPGSLVFGAGNWDTAQAVTVTAAHDGDAASDAAVTLTHTVAGSGEYAGVAAAAVVVTIVEDDASVLSVSGVSGSEDGGALVFTVGLSRAAGEEVTVDYATSDGTAEAGTDYTSVSGTLMFAANSTAAQTVTVPVFDDTADEDEEETLTLTLSRAAVASLAGGGSTLDVTGTIVDNDDPQVRVSFLQSTYSVTESDDVTITVTLNKEPERTVDVDITARGAGGAGSEDYSGAPTTVTFGATQTTATFTLTALDDNIDDDGESVRLGFETPLPDRVSTGTNATAAVSIDDDDHPQVRVSFERSAYSVDEGDSVTITVNLDADPERTVVVPITASGASDEDYTVESTEVTFGAAETSATFTFTAVDDTIDDDDESVRLGFGALLPDRVAAVAPLTAVVSIVDDDDPEVEVSFAASSYSVDEGRSVTVTVTLDADPERTVRVPITTANRGGASDSDYSGVPASVTFTRGERSASFTFTAVDDTIDDDGESVLLGFPATLPDRVSAGTNATATVNIEDDDHPEVEVSFAASSYSVDEGRSVTVTVTLDADPERTVRVPITTANLGGASNSDYSGVPGSVTFTRGARSESFTFTAVDDTIDDDGESVLLGFPATLPDRVSAGTNATATVNIEDDDHPEVR